ncbi:MAG: hypothetical protein JSV62_05290 [Promethearchaeota archaeon]|nr:MAG: hypothetical protein JSV62_05290 [Candidatus Lokiarchaeota archaeon]
MVKISNAFFPPKKKQTEVECPFCGYKITKPFPQNQLCPKCRKFLAILFDLTTDKEEKPEPKEFKPKITTLSSKLGTKVKVKEQPLAISLDSDKIKLKKGEYVKLMGITSTERTQLYCSNINYNYLLELANNLDFIATGILGGDLDKMLLISEKKEKEEKCQFYEKEGLIYLVYGRFPDKKGKWILEQMSNYFSELVKGKDIEELDKLDKRNIRLEFRRRTKFILDRYVQLQDVFTDQEIPYVEDSIRIDYLGLSSMSIGVISILIGEQNLNFDSLSEYESPEEEKEMKESTLTAKIEAIAANTQGNTGATPRWIAVKLGFQKYRFLTFKKYQNDYFLSLLSEGNLEKIEQIEKLLDHDIGRITSTVFSGNLKPFNTLKIELEQKFNKRRKFPPFEFN